MNPFDIAVLVIVAAGVIGFALFTGESIVFELIWLVPLIVVLATALFVLPPPFDVLGIVSVAALLFVMGTSERAAKTWYRVVTRSKDPWYRGRLPSAEMHFYVAMERLLEPIYRHTALSARQLQAIRTKLERLSPPDPDWAAVLAEAVRLVDDMASVSPPSGGDLSAGTAVESLWHQQEQLLRGIKRVRNERLHPF